MTAPPAGSRGRWLLLGTALAQAASPPLAGFDQGSGSDPVVVPPGPFFAIWGPVVLGCLAAAVYRLPVCRATTDPWRRVQLPLSAAQAGFVLWLVAAAQAPVLTLPVFAGMLAALLVCLRVVVRTPTDRWTRVLLGGSVGLYAGWASAAVWVNAATLLPEQVADGTAVPGLLLAVPPSPPPSSPGGCPASRPTCWRRAGHWSVPRSPRPAPARRVLAVVAAAGLAVVAGTAVTSVVRRPS